MIASGNNVISAADVARAQPGAASSRPDAFASALATLVVIAYWADFVLAIARLFGKR